VLEGPQFVKGNSPLAHHADAGAKEALAPGELFVPLAQAIGDTNSINREVAVLSWQQP